MKLAIIGCGRVFQHYLKTINLLKDISIVSIYDTNPSVLAQYPEYQSVHSIDALISSNADLYCVLTPSGTHYPIALYLIQNKCNVLVEKPLSLIPEHSENLEQASLKHDVQLFCAFQNRFNEAIQSAKTYLESSALGNIISSHVALEWCRYQDYYDDAWHGTWSLDGGVIAQQAIHHIDAVSYLLGKPTHVLGVSSRISNKLEAEDTFSGLIKHQSGTVSTLSASTAFRPSDKQASITIRGTAADIEISGIALNSFKFISESSTKHLTQDFPTGYGLSHAQLLTAIRDRLNGHPLHSALDLSLSIHTTKTISSLYHSNENNCWSTVGLDSSSLWGHN